MIVAGEAKFEYSLLATKLAINREREREWIRYKMDRKIIEIDTERERK